MLSCVLDAETNPVSGVLNEFKKMLLLSSICELSEALPVIASYDIHHNNSRTQGPQAVMSVVAKVMDQIDLVKMICSHVSLECFGALKLVSKSCYKACKLTLANYVNEPEKLLKYDNEPEVLLKCLFELLCTKTEGKLGTSGPTQSIAIYRTAVLVTGT